MCHKPSRVKQFVGVRRDSWDVVVSVPRVHKVVRELAARLDKKRARPHRRVANLEIEDGLRGRIVAQACKYGTQRYSDDRFGERPRRVEGTAPSALFVGLQDHGSSDHHVRGRSPIDLTLKRGFYIS